MTFTRTWFVSNIGKFTSYIANVVLFATVVGPVAIYLRHINEIGDGYFVLLTQISGASVVAANWFNGVARRIDRVWGNYPKVYELVFGLIGIASFAYGVFVQLSTTMPSD